MIKKRYVLSALLASGFFTVLYCLMDINLIVCLILTVIAYIGGIFLYKEKDIRKYDPNAIMHYCFLISKINNFKNSIKDEIINKNIDDITKKSEKIIDMLNQKPNKVTQVYNGFDFYLPTTIKVLEQYLYLIKLKKPTVKEKEFMRDINLCLDNIESEINKLLLNMNYTRMLDINSRIDVFKNDNKIVNEGVENNE